VSSACFQKTQLDDYDNQNEHQRALADLRHFVIPILKLKIKLKSYGSLMAVVDMFFFLRGFLMYFYFFFNNGLMFWLYFVPY
jgi:hypothetical protein